MKIGIVTPYDWSYPGGVRDHVWHLANEFISMGHDVRVLAPASGTKGKLTEKNILKMGRTTPIPHRRNVSCFIVSASVLHFQPRICLGLSIPAAPFSTPGRSHRRFLRRSPVHLALLPR